MQNRAFSLTVLDEKFSICRLDPSASVPERVYQSSFFSITRTLDELSIVCNEMHIPKTHHCSSGWRCLQVKGPLDLSETGILSALLRSLAEAKVPIFALSTYETDYLLVKEQDLRRTVEILESNGHKIIYF
ncbi:ACT domain-containing protein [Thermodesulfobacteriota bacterium]